MAPKNIQKHIDELVEDYKSSGMISTYFGVPLAEFTKEELIAIVHTMGTEQINMRERHVKDLNFITSLKRY